MNPGLIIVLVIIVIGAVVSGLSFYLIRKYANKPINGEVGEVQILRERIKENHETIKPILIKHIPHEAKH